MFVQEEAAFAGGDRTVAAAMEEEQRFIDGEAARGVVYLMGEATVTVPAPIGARLTGADRNA